MVLLLQDEKRRGKFNNLVQNKNEQVPGDSSQK